MLGKANQFHLGSDPVIPGLSGQSPSYLPNSIVSKVLYHVTSGDGYHAVLQGALLLLITTVTFLFVVYVGKRYYYRSWLMTGEFRARTNTVEFGRKRKMFDFRRESFLPLQLESLVKKEYFLFFREASQWIHLSLMIVLIGVFALSVVNIDLRLRVMEIQTVGYLILYAFCGFLSCSLALRFVFPAISTEGMSFWTQLSAPLNLKKPYFIKFVVGFLTVLLPALLVTVFSNLPYVRMSERRPILMYFGVYSAFWISLTLVSLNLGLGGYFSNYKEKNPIRLASSQGATLTFLMSLIYLITLVSITIVPLSEYFLSLFRFEMFDMSVIVVPATSLYLLSAALSVFALIVGLKSLQRDF